MTKYRVLVVLMTWLSVLPALRAQGYDAPDEGRYHESSIYYVTLQDANGRSINSDFSRTPRAIGAFVGGDLRGVSEQLTVNPSTGETVFAIRVWGEGSDPATVDFRLRYSSLEYLLATREFAPGEDVNYGTPSRPIVLKFIPATMLTLSPATLSVLVDASAYVEPLLSPLEHTTLLTPLTYTFSAGENTNIFTVDADGKVTGHASGQGLLTVKAMDGNRVAFSATATVSVINSTIHVTGIRNDLPSQQVRKVVGEDFRLLFTLLPENATNRSVSYQVSDYDVVAYSEDDRGITTFRGLKPGSATVTVVSADNPEVSLDYYVTITSPATPATAIAIRDGYDPIVVNKNDWQTLTARLSQAYVLTPEDASDEVVWRSADENIIQPLPTNTGWNPVNVGSTKMTACILNDDGSVRLQASLTAEVEGTVESIELWNSSFRALIGDTVSNPLSRIYYVTPGEARNQDVTYSIVSGNVLEKVSSGHIIARKPGRGTIRLTSVANPAVFADVNVEVMNPATGITIKKDTLRCDLRDPATMMEMADLFKANVEFTPTGYEYFGDMEKGIADSPRFISSDDAILNVSCFTDREHPADYQLMVNAWGGGVATVTVQLEVPDYMTYAHEPGGMVMMKYVEKSFVVVLQQYAQQLYLDPEMTINVGDKVDLGKLVTPWPEGSIFNPADIEWEVMNIDDLQFVKLEKGVVTALAPKPDGVYITGTVPGTALYVSMNIFIMQPATKLYVQKGYESITVNRGDYATLTDAIENAFVAEPANHTDYVVISFDPAENIYQYWNYDLWRDVYEPVRGGKVNVTATIYSDEMDGEGNPIPRLQATMEVTIEVELTAIEFFRKSIKLMPGDNIGPVLNSIVRIHPEDATHAEVAFKVLGGKVLKTADNGDIVASQVGRDTIVVTSVSKPSLTDTLFVNVVNPATGIVIKEEALEFEFNKMRPEDGFEIAQAIKDNISFTPSDYSFFGDPDIMSVSHFPIISSSDESVMFISSSESWDADWRDYHLECNPWSGGIVNVIVRLEIPNYVEAAQNLNDYCQPTVVEKSFKLTLVQDVEWLDIQYPVRVEEGQSIDLKDYITPMPEGCRMHWEDLEFKLGTPEDDEYITLEKNGIVKALKPKKSGVHIDVILHNTEIFSSTNLIVTRTAKSMTVKTGYETIVVNKDDNKTLNTMLNNALEILPEGYTDDVYWESSDENVVKPDRDFFGDYTFKTNSVGQSVLTATIYNYKDGEVDMSSPRLQVTIKVKVVQPLVEVAVSAPETMMVGVPSSITITCNKGASVEPVYTKLSETGGYKWPLLSYDMMTENNDGSLTITVTPLSPGNITVQLNYEELKAQSKSIAISVPTSLAKGWQWMTLWGGNVDKNPEKVFGVNADEIRSQTEILSRDETEGWFGSLELATSTAYMVKANTDVTAANAFQQEKGSFVTMKKNVSLYKGWTWLAYPYVNAFKPNELQLVPTPGDRIVSKNDGFVEYNNGQWTGTLTAIKPYTSCLYYNNAGKPVTLTWLSESSLYAAAHPAAAREVVLSDIADGSSASATRLYGPAAQTTSAGHWVFDHASYRNNMTMVACINSSMANILTGADAARYSIGAFVGSECRGDGYPVSGLMFITVHANAGELVSFRLYDSVYDVEYTINEQVVASMMLGTISQPYCLTYDATQGIDDMTVNGRQSVDCEFYDMLGRKLNGLHQGSQPVLVRGSDGKFRKVVVR